MISPSVGPAGLALWTLCRVLGVTSVQTSKRCRARPPVPWEPTTAQPNSDFTWSSECRSIGKRERRERGRDQFQRPLNTRDQPSPEANSLTRPLAPESLFHQRPKAPETKNTRDQQFQSTTPTTTHHNTIPHPATKQQCKQHTPQTPQKRTANQHPKAPPS